MRQGLFITNLVILLLFLAGCTGQSIQPIANNSTLDTLTPASLPSYPTQTSPPTTQSTPSTTTPAPIRDIIISPTATASINPPTPTYDPNTWTDLPVIPNVSTRVNEIYMRGLELGNNPNAFSKIGDCGSTPAWFLGDFDRGPRYYNLGEYDYLGTVIQEFHGSYDRTSLAAKSGFNASSIFSPLWSNRELCQSNESPIACEYRVHKPSFAFIMLGTNDVWHQDTFEAQMRLIIELSIDQGIVPVLSTKADNREGDGSINATIARLSYEYQIPLWNFWAALQELPDHGLQEDGSHLTWGSNQFNDPRSLENAWPVRNLTALQVLNAIWSSVISP